MHRTIIVARIEPETEGAVADVFAASDATSLPHEIGVLQRELYSLQDIYLHVIDLKDPPGEVLRRAQKLPGFQQISADLRPYIKPYDEQRWRTPQDAVAKQFYRWSAAER